MTKFLIFLLFLSRVGWSQNATTTELTGPRNIYNTTLQHYLVLTSQNKKPIYDTLFILQDEFITDSLTGDIKGVGIIIADSAIIQQQLNRGGALVLHKLFPLSFNDGFFSISIVVFLAKNIDGEIELVNAGTFKVEYVHDNKTKSFRFVKGRRFGY